MNNINEKNYCDGCGRHCPKDELRCERGRDLFERGYRGNTEGEARVMPFERRGEGDPHFRTMPHVRGEQPRVYGEHRPFDGDPRFMPPMDGRPPFDGRPPMDGRPPFDGRPPMGGRHRRGSEGPHMRPPMPPRPPRPRKLDYDSMDVMDRIGCNVRELSGRMRELSHGGQLNVLSILLYNGSMTQRELTERMAVQPGSASETIMKLEHSGLIAREANENDRRTAIVRLTDEGERRAKDAADRRHARADRLFERLTDEEKQRLLELLEKLNDWNGEEENTAFKGGNIQNV